jgi:hypothetical protein
MPGPKTPLGARASAAADAEAPAPQQLAKELETYLAEHPASAVLADGRVLFDMRTAKYSVGESHGRCLLQLWNAERNVVRTVVGVQARATCLRVTTRRMGAPKPESLEFVPTCDRRTPTTRDAARRNYQRLLERVLTRNLPGWTVDGMRSAMDLEHSFGPAYARGRLLKGTAAEAVIGIGESESGAAIDGILTLGILWLEYCRQHVDARRHVGGLKVIVPSGAWRTTAERIAWLNHAAADFQLFTLDQRTEELAQVDFRDTGNIQSRLVHAFSPQAAMERCRAGLDRVLALVPEEARERVELHARSATEVGLLLHGLEFARVRHGASASSFAQEDEISFGAGANETPLDGETEGLCRDLLARLFASRHPDGVHGDPLFRLQPERWLESRMRACMGEVLPGFRNDLVYSQVPALSASERGMLDLLTLDRAGRLVVLELKADEDLHLPLQALDYWIRVRALNDDRVPGPGGRMLSAFERAGYFAGTEVSPLPPRLVLAAPALRIHPANATVLRYLSPQVEWELIAVAEQWRSELRVVFRKRGENGRSALQP